MADDTLKFENKLLKLKNKNLRLQLRLSRVEKVETHVIKWMKFLDGLGYSSSEIDSILTVALQNIDSQIQNVQGPKDPTQKDPTK